MPWPEEEIGQEGEWEGGRWAVGGGEKEPQNRGRWVSAQLS